MAKIVALKVSRESPEEVKVSHEKPAIAVFGDMCFESVKTVLNSGVEPHVSSRRLYQISAWISIGRPRF
jgi:hypothetical protein